MKKILLISALALISACTSSNDFNNGKSQLEQQGYTDVKNTGHNFFCCSNDDSFSTGFSCKDKSGNTIKGCFCSSVLKGVTIRFE